MGLISKYSAVLTMLEARYGLDSHKVHLLALAQVHWERDLKVRVTDLLNSYSGMCRANTHRAIKDLESMKLFKLVSSEGDRRERLIHPGALFTRFEKNLEGWQ